MNSETSATPPSELELPAAHVEEKGLFSMPIEIRKQIYCYLVGRRYTCDQPPYYARGLKERNQWSDSMSRHKSVAITYQFNMSISRVNRKLHAEVVEEFHCLNDFVKVYFHWPALSTIIHAHNVPIVADDHGVVSRLPHHSMRILLRHRDCPRVQGKEWKEQCVIMLLQDMYYLSDAIRWSSSKELSMPVIYKDVKKNLLRVLKRGTLETKFQLHVKLIGRAQKPMNEKLMLRLLQPLHSLTVPGMEVMPSSNIPRDLLVPLQ